MTSIPIPYIFIVGSPRSGTTILGEVLNLHREINQWHEPYFIWDKFFRLAPDDQRTAEDATQEVIKYVTRQCNRYHRKTRFCFLVDKSPRNSLKIPFVRKIFPEARFIHIVRDGRDTALSINNEWINLKQIYEGANDTPGFDYTRIFEAVSISL